MYSLLIDGNSEHKKAKYVNKNLIKKITRSEYKDVLLHKKCLRHSMNRVQRKKSKNRNLKLQGTIELFCVALNLYPRQWI